jgi:hypothetical protein
MVKLSKEQNVSKVGSSSFLQSATLFIQVSQIFHMKRQSYETKSFGTFLTYICYRGLVSEHADQRFTCKFKNHINQQLVSVVYQLMLEERAYSQSI